MRSSPSSRSRRSLSVADSVWVFWLLSTTLLLLAYRPAGSDWAARSLAHLVLVGAIAGLARLPTEPPRRPLELARALYPILMVAYAWGELRVLIPLLFERDYWATQWIVRADAALFGGHPTVLVQGMFRPWLDELMALTYMSYYLFLAVPAFLLFLGRDAEARTTAALISIAYVSNFVLFILVPVKSPPQIVDQVAGLEPSAFTGYYAAAAVRSLQSSQSVLGAAFPSSHVAGSLVCALAARRWAPRLGRVLLPLALGVAAATVYLGYHHALDPIAGLAAGAACYAAGTSWLGVRGELPAPRSEHRLQT